MAAHLVLGLGGTVDLEVRWDAALYEAFAREHGITREELTTSAPIVDERDLIMTILAFFAAGTGGERFVASSALIERFAARFTAEITLGGTGVRAGIALDRLQIPTIQHLVSIDDNVRRLLPVSMRVVSSATRDTYDPHLIVQYPAGTTVQLPGGDVLVSPDADRLIFANDRPNREMAIAHALADALEDASVFLISGFNTMQDVALLDRRLDELLVAMRRLPHDALVYYEDAGFYKREFADRIRRRLLPRIDVYGMNEDELQEYLGRSIDLLSTPDVSAALEEVRRVIPARTLVIHTRYWAIGVGDEADRHRTALESAVRVAATRYRLGDGFVAADIDDTERMPRHRLGVQLVEQVERAGLGAVGVAGLDLDVATPTTIGLGDTFVGGFLAAYAPRDGDPR